MVFPLDDRACAWVEKYLNDIRPQLVDGDDCDHLFLIDYGEPFVKNPMTDLVKKYLNAAGIDKVGACKLFRTHMLENGVYPEILRHVNSARRRSIRK